MAWNWANVVVAPTGASGLTSGTVADLDEPPPWDDTDFCHIQLSSLGTGTAIFNGFDLSNAGGEKKGFWITVRVATSHTSGFTTVLTLKQDTTTLWTSASFGIIHPNMNFKTYQFKIPDSAFSGNPDIDNLSIEFGLTNLRANTQQLQFSFLRLSKSPFTTAQQAVLPSTLSGQNAVVYRASDLGVLGATDAEAILILPDATGGGCHSYLRVGTATYETDAPAGILADTCRLAGSLGYDPATDAITTWADVIQHAKVYPTGVPADTVICAAAQITEFIDGAVPGNKHLLGALVTTGQWVMMTGDGSAPAHLSGGSVATSVEQRITSWARASGNEMMWEEDDASPIVDGASGANPFYMWSLLDRESDDRPFFGRLMEWWAVEATGITEGDIDTARDEWVNGISGSPLTATVGALRSGTIT